MELDPWVIIYGVYVASVLAGLLILWFVIYTAVRAALSSHRSALAEEREEREARERRGQRTQVVTRQR
ncbi:hypothetical protein N8K70_13235 [Microbacterium betulae]|uniref:Uncharacterized protein n=1 Tax=Microbacterium betulae TaxID=2981139 RepID=A0AA97FIV2_9MICO|nr:hypothetical protein [Microbacterium sp. AB]WOF22342.1 hypothetical protein N8K70_13235 [Microbacterium sp. AB]